MNSMTIALSGKHTAAIENDLERSLSVHSKCHKVHCHQRNASGITILRQRHHGTSECAASELQMFHIHPNKRYIRLSIAVAAKQLRVCLLSKRELRYLDKSQSQFVGKPSVLGVTCGMIIACLTAKRRRATLTRCGFNKYVSVTLE